MSITGGSTGLASDFINQSEANGTPANDAGRVPKLESDGKLNGFFMRPPVRRVYTYTSCGATSTRFDVTNPAGTTFRYTYDGTGTDPNISAVTFPAGTQVSIFSTNLSAGNRGNFIVTASGANYFEITNASGVAENDKTLAGGYLFKNSDILWTRPSASAGLKWIEIEGVGGGGAGGYSNSTDGGSSGGGGGGYFRKILSLASLVNATEAILVGGAGMPATGTGGTGGTTSFGAHASATGGVGGTNRTVSENGGVGGVGTGGDINIDGGTGGDIDRSYSGTTAKYLGGFGGCSKMAGNAGGYHDTSQNAGLLYGGGGGGIGLVSSTFGVRGGYGILIITEYY